MTAGAVGKSCIFCGRTPLTKEHVWPRWLAKHAGLGASLNQWSEPEDRYPIARIRVERGRTTTWHEAKGRSPRQSDHVVRAVCTNCNSGWMAALEAEAKPILTRQMADRNDRLTPDERDVLVRWLLKTTAVYEMDDPQSAVLPADVRTSLTDDLRELRGLWEVGACWVPAGGEMYALAHGRAVVRTPDAAELGQSLLQVLWIGQAGYIVQFRTGENVRSRRMRLVRRMPLLPVMPTDVRRPSVNPIGWWRLIRGRYVTKLDGPKR